MVALRAMLLLTLLPLPAVAEHCQGWSTSEAGIAAGDLYVVVDLGCLQFEILCSVWVYGESNGIPGLQRGDEVVDDTCHGMIDGDTVVF